MDHRRLLSEIRVEALPATPEELDAEGARVTWSFDDPEKRWWNEQLMTLESDLIELRGRIEIAERCATTADAHRLWSEARAAIKVHRQYGAMDLGPQLFLFPLGPDPESGLWEFAHLLSGETAVRGAYGELVLTSEAGLVFVLLPGGRLPVEDGEELGPFNAVDLAPFFLAKYEMTRNQWARITDGWTCDQWEGQTPLLPANYLSWDDCQTYLGHSPGWIRLLSEAQWEYGCRAGTTTKWWTGADEALLRGAANIDFDMSDSIYGKPVPVGTLRANPFGLHDVHGNLWEWCDNAVSPGLDEYRHIRGGAYTDPAENARSDFQSAVRRLRYQNGGLRPASPLTF